MALNFPSLDAFAASQFQGQQLLLDQDAKRADIDVRRQQADGLRTQNLIQKQSLQDKADLQKWMQADSATRDAPATTAADLAKQYTKAEQFALSRGNYEGAAEMSKLAKGQLDLAEKAQVQAEKAKVDASEELSTAAQDYTANPSPEARRTLFQKAVAAGVPPDQVPMPGTAGFDAFVKNSALSALKGGKRLEFLDKVRHEDQLLEEKKQEAKTAHEDRVEQRKATAAARESALELLKSGLELRKQLAESAASEKSARREEKEAATQFKETEQLNTKLQQSAKPLLNGLERVNTIQGLLATDSSAADQQIHQSLVAAVGDFKGRATNLFYKDNKNFGDVVDKLEGWTSRAFTGRYSENDRAAITQLVSDAKSKVIEPALVKLEQQQKAHAASYNLDPSRVEIVGDFDRSAKPPVQSYSEGQTATGPGGKKLIFKDGKWSPL